MDTKILMRSFSAVMMAAIIAMTSCGSRDQSATDEYNVSLYTPEYAGGFTITGADGYKSTIITVSNPWQGADSVVNRLFIARDGESAPYDFDGQVLDGDAGRIVAMSSTHVAMLDAIGKIDHVVGVSGKQFITNQTILSRGDSVGDVGYDGNINYEQLIALDPDIVLLYGVNGASRMEGKLEELGIPYVYIGDYLEQSPLGKAEWMVAVAELTGDRDHGVERFAEIPASYNALKQKVALSVLDAPSVVFNIPYGDAWFMPSTESYVARLVADAGGNYLYQKNNGNVSKPVDLEEAYQLVYAADMWMDVGRLTTLDEIKIECPKFADTRCVRNGYVYNNNLRSTPAGGNDYYESGVVRPDLLLRDFVKIFHPELVEEDFVYYQKLK